MNMSFKTAVLGTQYIVEAATATATRQRETSLLISRNTTYVVPRALAFVLVVFPVRTQIYKTINEDKQQHVQLHHLIHRTWWCDGKNQRKVCFFIGRPGIFCLIYIILINSFAQEMYFSALRGILFPSLKRVFLS